MQRLLLLLGLIALSASASADDKNDYGEGAHRVVAVVNIVSREDAMRDLDHAKLENSGIDVADVVDGSFAVGIVYCCNEKISRDEKIVFYVPADVQIQNYDFVEVRMGRKPSKRKKDKGIYHRAVKHRLTPGNETGECRWDPGDQRMWMNIVYCDWMEDEGWILKKGATQKFWYLPPPQSG